MEGKKKPAKLREASLAVAHALAQLAPQRPTKDDILDVLAPKDKAANSMQETKNREAAAKTLSRMITRKQLKEVVVPIPDQSGLNLAETGLVAVSISLTELNNKKKAWFRDKESGLLVGDEPSQVNLAQDLRVSSRDWLNTKFRGEPLPLFVKDIWIVHGSTSFDLIIVVMYRESKDFLNYIRDVVQSIDCVDSTQTMLITSNLSETTNDTDTLK